MQDGIKYISDLNWGYRAARVLHLSNQLEIFTILSGTTMTAEELCRRCNTEPDLLEKLLIACAAMGLLSKEGLSYKNSEISEKYLVKDKPLYQGDIIAHSASVWHFWDKLEEEMCPSDKRGDSAEIDHKNFIMGMHNIAVGGRAQIFIDNVDLSGCKKLFDIGGGPGTYSISACKKYPALKAIVFDLPETIKITREMISKNGMSERVSVLEGDWEKNNFVQGNDAVLFSNVLHGPFSKAELKLKKAFDSMISGGLLIIQEFLLNEEKTGPLIPALFNIMVGAYSTLELSTLINQTGFINSKLVKESEKIGCTWITANKP